MMKNTRVRCSLAAVGILPVALGGILASSTGVASASAAPVKVAVLNESTGEFGAQFGAVVPGAQAWASYVNSHGGVDGHKIELTVYNNASSPSQEVANAHLAVESGAVAIIQSDPLFDGSAPYLKSVGIPVYGFGITPGFYGPTETNFFSYSGNVTNGKAVASEKFLIDKKGKTKWALISDASPADSGDVKAEAATLAKIGGKVVYSNYTVDPTNTASLLAVAQAIKASGAQVVGSAAGGTEAQFQADLAQVGAGNIWVADGSDYQQNLPEQFGAALNNYTFYFFTAPFTASTPGMQHYLATMKKTSPSNEYNFNALVGWASAALLQGGLEKVGSGAVTRASLTKATNELKNYTGDGILAPVSFPLFHTQATECFAFVQVQNQKWVDFSGTKASPFYCAPPLP